MALLAPILLLLLVGLWEVGRIVMIQNLLDNAAREGARLAASGAYFSSDNHQSPADPNTTITLGPPSTNTSFELQQKVVLYLQASGVSTTGVTVTVANAGTSGNSKSWSYTWTQTGSGSGSGNGYDPTAAADQLDQLTITVTLPYQNVSWSPVSWFIGSSTTLSATTTWSSLRDAPLNVSTTIPSQPIQPTDPLP
jgi:Flp pilus assembly protein TadG